MQSESTRITLACHPYITSPEDTILAKLEWSRMSGEVSDRQWRDTP